MAIHCNSVRAKRTVREGLLVLVDFTHPYIDDIWVGEIRQFTSESNSEKGNKSTVSLFFLFDRVQNHQNSTFHETETL